jgi:hypothetical protein
LWPRRSPFGAKQRRIPVEILEHEVKGARPCFERVDFADEADQPAGKIIINAAVEVVTVESHHARNCTL